MFQITEVGKGWYEDGEEDGENLFRLDYHQHGNDFQAQLFLTLAPDGNPENGYSQARIFVERDNRLPGDVQIRIDYACQHWDITPEEAQALLKADSDQAQILLVAKTDAVAKLPNDREFIRKYPHGKLPETEAHWAKIDALKTTLSHTGEAEYNGHTIRPTHRQGYTTNGHDFFLTVEEAVNALDK